MASTPSFAQAVDAAYAAYEAMQALQGNTRDRAKMAALESHRAACRAVSEAFAIERGWRVSQPFTLRQLQAGSVRALKGDEGGAPSGGVVDHPEFYRAITRPYRPVAIISHTYHALVDVLAFAGTHGLACEVLAVKSWYYPGACLPVLFTRIPAEVLK